MIDQRSRACDEFERAVCLYLVVASATYLAARLFQWVRAGLHIVR